VLLRSRDLCSGHLNLASGERTYSLIRKNHDLGTVYNLTSFYGYINKKKGAAEIIIFFYNRSRGRRAGGLSAVGTHGQKEA